jgi:hypothetical protein
MSYTNNPTSILAGTGIVATPITIAPGAGIIDGVANATINTPYGSLTLIYDGVQWLIT